MSNLVLAAIREHFHDVDSGDRRNPTIQCNYCGKQQAGGNPKRCQRHLDECPSYANILATFEYNEVPFNAFDPSGNAATAAQLQAFPAGSLGDGSQQTPQQAQMTAAAAGLAPTPERILNEANIKRTLHLSDSNYYGIERDLDAQLSALNISGAGLHTPSGQNLLKQAFYQVHLRWPNVFNDIPEQEKTRALTSLAHICNRKRRNGNPPYTGSPVTPQTQLPGPKRSHYPNPGTSPVTPGNVSQMGQSPGVMPESLPSVAPSKPVQVFGTTTIIAERSDGEGAFVVCRPSDLIDEPKSAEDITVNDVRFHRFLALLQGDDDVMFDDAQDKIMYTFTGGRTKAVTSEVVWRVALEEMLRKGMDPFVFNIYKR